MFKKIICVLAMLPSLASASLEKQEFNSDKIREVEVLNQSGNITIEATDGLGKTVVGINKIQFGKDCLLKTELNGSKLEVKIQKSNPSLISENCRADINISMPKKVSVDIENGSGNLDIQKILGEIEFKMGQGNVKLNGSIEEVEGSIGQGSISIEGLLGDADLKIGNGDIHLTYNSTAQKGKVAIETGKGNALVLLPASAQVYSHLESGFGRLTSEFANAPKAPFEVQMKGGMGNLELRKLAK